MVWALVVLVFAVMAMAYTQATRKAHGFIQNSRTSRIHSRPIYHGWYSALWAGGPALCAMAVILVFRDNIVTSLVYANLPDTISTLPPERIELFLRKAEAMAKGQQDFSQVSFPADVLAAASDHYTRLYGLVRAVLVVTVIGTCAAGLLYARKRLSAELRARPAVERFIRMLLLASSAVAILTTLGIVLSLLFEALRFFNAVSVFEFLFGMHWSPQIALRDDQVGQSGGFGAVPLFAGTLLIMAIAMITAAPIGLFSAIYLSEYATKHVRDIVKPVLEVLAGIPTVVYGFFAALTVGPFVRAMAEGIGFSVPNQTALAAGVVMGIMIIPFISSLSDDVINAVPQSLRDGAYAMGATKSETVKNVILPAALPGIVGALLLAVSRAIGETMIVTMAAGQAANLTANPFDQVTTVTVQIVMLLTGDQEFDSPKTLAAFGLGLTLFIATLSLNVIALRVVQKYREKYE